MRDPSLADSRSMNDLRVKPPHGRQTRVALGLEANGEDNSNANAYSRTSNSLQNGQSRNYGTEVNGVRQDNAALQNGLTALGAPENVQLSEPPVSGRPQPLPRARSDFGPRHRGERHAAVVEEDLWRMRHGWEDEYTSNEYLALLNSVGPMMPANTPPLTDQCRRSTCTIQTRDMTRADYRRKVLGRTQTGA
jgi:hypothetical protein